MVLYSLVTTEDLATFTRSLILVCAA